MKQFKNILYISEPSVEQESAVARAVTLSQSNQAKLTIIDAIPEQTAGIRMPSGGPIAADLTAAMIAERREMLESLIVSSPGDRRQIAAVCRDQLPGAASAMR